MGHGGAEAQHPQTQRPNPNSPHHKLHPPPKATQTRLKYLSHLLVNIFPIDAPRSTFPNLFLLLWWWYVFPEFLRYCAGNFLGWGGEGWGTVWDGGWVEVGITLIRSL